MYRNQAGRELKVSFLKQLFIVLESAMQRLKEKKNDIVLPICELLHQQGKMCPLVQQYHDCGRVTNYLLIGFEAYSTEGIPAVTVKLASAHSWRVRGNLPLLLNSHGVKLPSKH